ncbi:MAG: putative Ig domain-containing protein [Planctomycetota bacterium]
MRVLPRVVVLAVLALLLSPIATGCKNSATGNNNAASVGTLAPASLPGTSVGAPYSQALTLTGSLAAQTPLTWSITAGALPPGVALDTASTTATSQISGTPAIAGDYNFTLHVQGTTDSATFDRSISVASSSTLVITTTSLPDGTTAANYAQMLNATGGTGIGYTWQLVAGNLPPNVVLDGHNVTTTIGSFSLSGNLDLSLGGGRLTEVSGMVASRHNPGTFWVHDDSGAGPEFYAIDAAGNIQQRYQITAAAQDWEDIAIGPGPDADTDYIYIGDVGDNASARTNCRIYRVAEPIVPGTPGSAITLPHDEFWFVYPGGSQNCESMIVDFETGTPYLVEKTAGAPRVHRFPMPLDTAWTSGSPTTLIAVTASGTFDGTLTGGDASADARRVILRGYSSAREYARPAGGSFDDIFLQAGSAVTITGGQQYEAICYSADGTKVYTATELAGQANAPIQVASVSADIGSTTLSGTPGATGLYTFTVQVTDSAGNTATRELTIAVN